MAFLFLFPLVVGILAAIFLPGFLAKTVKVVADDCGPLSRGKFGVVFSLAPHGSGKSYFTEGNSMELCPKILQAKSLVGYEVEYCDKYDPIDPKECSKVKVFEITKFNYE